MEGYRRKMIEEEKIKGKKIDREKVEGKKR